jgi:hypothetical protein
VLVPSLPPVSFLGEFCPDDKVRKLADVLSAFESGFIPAGLYTITRWYTQAETSKRFSWYFVGNMTASATSGLIAYGM